MTSMGSDVVLQNTAGVVLQQLLSGAEHVPQGGRWAPRMRWNPSWHRHRVCWGSLMPAALHTPRKGGTRDANGHAALPVCDTCSRLLLAQVYNKGFYAKVAFNKGLKVTCVSLQPKAVDDYRGLDGPTLKWPWFLCLWLQGFFKPMLNSPLWIKPDFVLWFCAPTVINFTQWV